MKLKYKELNNIPTYYHLLNIKIYNIYIKDISINIKSIHNDQGARIHCEFTNGNKYTALVFNEKHYNQEISKIQQMAYNDIEQQAMIVRKKMLELLRKDRRS